MVEFIVTVAASAGFLLGLGTAGISLSVVGALLAGGLVAAPVAAWLVSRLPDRVLGSAVGGVIVLTNLRTVLSALDAPSPLTAGLLLGFVPLWALLATASVRGARRPSSRTVVGARPHETPTPARESAVAPAARVS